jgi:hypothetical protein
LSGGQKRLAPRFTSGMLGDINRPVSLPCRSPTARSWLPIDIRHETDADNAPRTPGLLLWGTVRSTQAITVSAYEGTADRPARRL